MKNSPRVKNSLYVKNNPRFTSVCSNPVGSRRSVRTRQRVFGFTLVEVMVALVIIGLALPALMMRMSTMANSAVYARETTMAHWVAENKMEEILLDRQLRKRSIQGRQAGDVEMAGMRWDWQYETKPEKEGPLQLLSAHKITLRVGRQGEEPLVELVGYFID